MSVSPQFYEPFADFDYILIYQLDAFVFYDALEEFCALGYDYIGAPWPRHVWHGSREPKTPRVGNSGLCLRKVKACLNLAEQANIPTDWSTTLKEFSDDGFFAVCGVDEDIDFNVAPVEVANLFAMEWYPARHVKHFGLPFGCHGWTIFGADFYVELFARFGYDLRSFRAQMGNKDRDHWRHFLMEFVMNRLIRDARRGRSVLRYLPTKRFASVQILRSPGTTEVLSRLLAEDKTVADKVFVREKEDWPDLLRDVKPEELPHLLLTLYDDEDLLKLLAAERGLRYGEHVISFRREYLNHCEKIFRALGGRTPR